MRKGIAILGLLLLLATAAAPAGALPDLPGWTPVAETFEEYGPDGLWEHINGGADAYLAFGFRGLTYTEVTDGERIFAVETYRMGSALDAFGIYRLENPAVAETLAVGAEACLLAPFEARMLSGDRYLKLVAVEGDVDADSAGSLLAHLSAEDDALPAELFGLPMAGRRAGTERFVRESLFGLKELRGGLIADYFLELEPCQFFFLPEWKGVSAEDLLPRLGKRWETVTRKGRAALLARVPYQGTVVMMETKQGWLGLTGIADEDKLIAIIMQSGGC